MKKLGLKRLLLLSVMLLVGLSVSVSSYILYLQEKAVLTERIVSESRSHVEAKAAVIETMVNEKVGAINKLIEQYRLKPLTGTPAEIIERTHFLAHAMNLSSAAIAFENGDAYDVEIVDYHH